MCSSLDPMARPHCFFSHCVRIARRDKNVSWPGYQLYTRSSPSCIRLTEGSLNIKKSVQIPKDVLKAAIRRHQQQCELTIAVYGNDQLTRYTRSQQKTYMHTYTPILAAWDSIARVAANMIPLGTCYIAHDRICIYPEPATWDSKARVSQGSATNCLNDIQSKWHIVRCHHIRITDYWLLFSSNTAVSVVLHLCYNTRLWQRVS